MLTDAQLHVWEADRPDRPWDRQHRPQLDEPFTVERAVELLDEHGVDRAVLVPPLVSGFNNDTANAYALEAVAAYPDRFAVMGRFDPRPPDARDRLGAGSISQGCAACGSRWKARRRPNYWRRAPSTGSGRRPSAWAWLSTSCA